jgi:putative thioredoxin
LLQAARELEPIDDRVITALASVLATDGRGEDALALLEKVPETAETRRIAALARTGADAGGDVEARLTDLLDRVKEDETARQEYVDLLELLADEDARGPWRRQLSARLF